LGDGHEERKSDCKRDLSGDGARILQSRSLSDFAATALVDGFGNAADARAGLAVLQVHYSDGENGVVVVVCTLGPPPR
jgi:hypothetical protein